MGIALTRAVLTTLCNSRFSGFLHSSCTAGAPSDGPQMPGSRGNPHWSMQGGAPGSLADRHNRRSFHFVAGRLTLVSKFEVTWSKLARTLLLEVVKWQ